MRKIILSLALAALALIPNAGAQDYPTHVIALVSPFPPGGPSDTTARLVIGPMSKALGQQIVEMAPDSGRGEPEPAAERAGRGRPEFEDQPRDLPPRGGSGSGSARCSGVFHNIIVP